jgi:hypothetical protein
MRPEPGGRNLYPLPGCFLPIPPPDGGPESEILMEFKNFYRET